MTKHLTKVKSIYFDHRLRGSAHALEKTMKAGVVEGALSRGSCPQEIYFRHEAPLSTLILPKVLIITSTDQGINQPIASEPS